MADEKLEFVVADTDPRNRADRLIVWLLGRAGRHTTRAEVQRWMAEGRVQIDGKPARQSKSVAGGARVAVEPGPPLASSASPDPTVPFTVVYEDAHLLVVDKPAGIVVHPARGHREGTLVHGLLAHRAAQADLLDPRDPEGHLRPGIVHRIDRDTSGLLVIAKDSVTREALKQRFAAHDIERSYLALVAGHPSAATYNTPYGRHPRQRIRFTSRLPPDHPGARHAITHVDPLEQWDEAACVRCRLETGRTHQIRVHLAEQAGTPILGDRVYGSRPRTPLLQRVAALLGRQALHAATLGFDHPATGQPMRWHSEPPQDFRQATLALREAATRPST